MLPLFEDRCIHFFFLVSLQLHARFAMGVRCVESVLGCFCGALRVVMRAVCSNMARMSLEVGRGGEKKQPLAITYSCLESTRRGAAGASV